MEKPTERGYNNYTLWVSTKNLVIAGVTRNPLTDMLIRKTLN